MATATQSESDYIDVNEAGALLGCSHWTIRRRIADGALPGFRIGPRTLRVRRSDVLALLQPIPCASTR